MNLKATTKLLKENRIPILENLKLAKQYLDANKISKEEFETLVKADPSPQKKYVGWMTKCWITEHPDIDELRNTVEEYNTLVNKHKIETKDINQYKSFGDLKKDVDQVNQSGSALSSKDLEKDFETIIDNEDLLVCVPHTHEASRKLGITKFAFRDCTDEHGKKTGQKDSAWCTTYKVPDHFNDYYYENNVTFYYIRVRSQAMIKELKKTFPKNYKSYEVVALALLGDSKNKDIDGYDGLDKQMNSATIKKFISIIGIS